MQYAYGSLNTDPLGKKWYPQLHGRALRSSAPSMYPYFLCDGWAGRVRFCPGASVFKSLNQISSSSKETNLLALSL